MAEARRAPVVVALEDGRAVVFGGAGDDGPLSSVEIFDPRSESWSPAADLAEPRSLHAATRLADGRVLITGGYTAAPAGTGAGITRAEIFDPVSGLIEDTTPMPVRRYLHDSVRLASGAVLVSGGYALDLPIESAVLFDPATETWSSLDVPPLVAGGYIAFASTADGAVAAASDGIHYFDEANSTWSLGHVPPDPRQPVLDVPVGGALGARFSIATHNGWFGAGERELFDWTRLWVPEVGTPTPYPSALLNLCDSALVIGSVVYEVPADALQDPTELDVELDAAGGARLTDGSLLVVGGVSGPEPTVLSRALLYR